MSTPAEHAEALAWVRKRVVSLTAIGATLSVYFLALTLAEAVLTRHAPAPDQRGSNCKDGCGDFFDDFPCPDATDALAFVKAVRG